jgi:hypothetical protein
MYRESSKEDMLSIAVSDGISLGGYVDNSSVTSVSLREWSYNKSGVGHGCSGLVK